MQREGADYHRQRAKRERALAAEANISAAKIAHEKLAQHHEKLAEVFEPYPL